jgi:hypothetical protein
MTRKTNRGAATLAVAFAVLLVGMVSGASAQLQNPSFEAPSAAGGDMYGSDNWNSFGYTYTTAAVAHTGSQCLKTFGPFSQYGGSGCTQVVPAAPGQTWIGEIYALNWTADPIDNADFGVFKIEFLDASFNFAAGATFGVDVFESNPINGATARDAWTLLGVGTAPAPAGTAWARAVIVKVDMDGTQGGSIFWDDASLTLGNPVAVQPTTISGIKSLYR